MTEARGKDALLWQRRSRLATELTLQTTFR